MNWENIAGMTKLIDQLCVNYRIMILEMMLDLETTLNSINCTIMALCPRWCMSCLYVVGNHTEVKKLMLYGFDYPLLEKEKYQNTIKVSFAFNGKFFLFAWPKFKKELEFFGPRLFSSGKWEESILYAWNKYWIKNLLPFEAKFVWLWIIQREQLWSETGKHDTISIGQGQLSLVCIVVIPEKVMNPFTESRFAVSIAWDHMRNIEIPTLSALPMWNADWLEIRESPCLDYRACAL